MATTRIRTGRRLLLCTLLGGINRYSHVTNDPANSVDPFGFQQAGETTTTLEHEIAEFSGKAGSGIGER